MDDLACQLKHFGTSVKGGCANPVLSPLGLHREILAPPPCTTPQGEAEGLPDLDPALPRPPPPSGGC